MNEMNKVLSLARAA